MSSSAALSGYVLHAPIRTNEIITPVTVPDGMTRLALRGTALVYARKGSVDAQVPDSSVVSNGSGSFPLEPDVTHDLVVSAGERLTFVAQVVEEGRLFLAFA